YSSSNAAPSPSRARRTSNSSGDWTPVVRVSSILSPCLIDAGSPILIRSPVLDSGRDSQVLALPPLTIGDRAMAASERPGRSPDFDNDRPCPYLTSARDVRSSFRRWKPKTQDQKKEILTDSGDDSRMRPSSFRRMPASHD